MSTAANHEELNKTIAVWGGAEIGGRLIGKLFGKAVQLVRGTHAVEGAAEGGGLLEGAAASPRVTYRPNSGGTVRNIHEAVAIAKAHGAPIDGDLMTFSVAGPGELASNQYARYWSMKDLKPNSIVTWKSFLNSVTGKVAVRVSPEVLKSDDAIVGVLTHEAHEIQALEAEFAAEGGRMRADKLRGLIDEQHGALHSDAWDESDALVRKRQAEDAPQGH
jgi:hypothetical protein